MHALRTHARMGPLLRRGLFTFALALALVTGLLSMHVLHSTGSHTDTVTAATTHGSGWAAETFSTAPFDLEAEACADGCDTPARAPADPALLVTCVLALLSAVVFLAPRVSLLRAAAVRELRHPCIEVTGLLAHPRPPSLRLLSISRT